MQIFWYLIYTLLLEIPVLGLVYNKQVKAALFFALLVNCLTWPIFQLIRERLGDAYIPVLEIGIVSLEGIMYWILLKGKFQVAFFASFIANGLSYGLDFLID